MGDHRSGVRRWRSLCRIVCAPQSSRCRAGGNITIAISRIRLPLFFDQQLQLFFLLGREQIANLLSDTLHDFSNFRLAFCRGLILQFRKLLLKLLFGLLNDVVYLRFLIVC